MNVKRLETKVRVFLNSDKVMKHPKYCPLENEGHELYALPIKFKDGRFFMDAINGNIPRPIQEFVSGWYSIHSDYVPGFRHGGLYHDERFAQTEAEVRPCNVDRLGGSNCFLIEICGAGLENVMGLYDAIVADEILPMSLGSKTATQLIDELQAKLDGSLAMIAQLQDDLLDTQLRFESAQETIDFIAEKRREVEAELAIKKTLLDEFEVERAHQLVNANRSWYKKLSSWFLKELHESLGDVF